jgi:PAS domain S-box-containing protein
MQFSVSDTGTGIPSHEINRIFEKFHRVHEQKGRSYEGTGIGLALTQELVKLHDGNLEVESTYGHGTTFTVYIRLGNSHLPEDQLVRGTDLVDMEYSRRHYGESVVEEAGRWTTRESQSDVRSTSFASSDTNSTVALQASQWVPISSRGCRILVADDNDDMRRYVKGVLLQFYEVIEAANGQEALSIVVQEKPDLILSDVMMPELSGYGFLKIIRSSPETRSTPFILLSARAGDEARVEGLLAGADDYLAKPFNARELIARVHTHLDIARMRVELEKRVIDRTKDLTESEERYRLLPLNVTYFRILSAISPVGIFRIDLSGVVTYANSKWREITGIQESLDDSTGESLLSAVHPDDRESIEDCWNGAIERTERCSFEARWGTRKSFRWAMGEIVPEVISEKVIPILPS